MPSQSRPLLLDQTLDPVIRIDRITINTEAVRPFAEARQHAQPLNRQFGLGLARVDPDELDLVRIVVALIFVMNHKNCSKPLAQSASPRSPQDRCPPFATCPKDSDERAEYAM